MKLNSAVLRTLFASALFLEAQSGPVASDTAHGLEAQGYGSVPVTFVGPAVPGGENVTLNGSAEEVYNQLLKLNPTYNEDFKVELDKRNDGIIIYHSKPDANSLRCNLKNYIKVDEYAIANGIASIKSLKGWCKIGAGPRKCARFSCSYDSGIYFCNDHTEPIYVYCPDIAVDYAEAIWDKCHPHKAGVFNGQMFDVEHKFNVILGGTAC